nr:Ig lambda pseudogene [Homo sapiens]
MDMRVPAQLLGLLLLWLSGARYDMQMTQSPSSLSSCLGESHHHMPGKSGRALAMFPDTKRSQGKLLSSSTMHPICKPGSHCSYVALDPGQIFSPLASSSLKLLQLLIIGQQYKSDP